MFVIIGIGVVLAAVIGGYLMEHGNLSVLLQPAELVIIFGAATGGFLISSPLKVIKAVVGALARMFSYKNYGKADYVDALMLLNGIFYKIRQQGLVSIESDVDAPSESALFSKYPNILKNRHAIDLITDTLRTVMTTTIASHELEALIDSELENHHEELLRPAQSVSFVADALPGLGIVAAVLGVIHTMGAITEPPEVLGHLIGGALVGTFVGVWTSYGFIAPISNAIRSTHDSEMRYLHCIKSGLLAHLQGYPPAVSVEFARKALQTHVRPTFYEVEEATQKLQPV